MMQWLFVGLSLLCFPLIALETEHSEVIPQADGVYRTSLSNGIRIYIHEYPSSQLWGSFRVVFKHPSLEHTLYTFDSKTEEWNGVEDFFLSCLERAQMGGNSAIESRYASSASSSLNPFLPQEIAVVAVGGFTKEKMLPLIEHCFAQISLADPSSSDPVYVNDCPTLEHAHVAINVSLPTSHAPIHTFGDLKECWKSLFLQELFQQRLEECTRGFDECWIHPHPHCFYPVSGFAVVPEEETENLLAFFLWHLEMLSNQGFYLDSFAEKKKQLLHQLHHLVSQAEMPSPSYLASYYKDQFLLGDCCHNHREFLTASVDCVAEMEFEDLLPLLDSFVDKAHRKIHLAYASDTRLPRLSEEKIAQLEETISSLIELYQANDSLEEEEDEENESLSVRFTRAAPVGMRLVTLQEEPTFVLAQNLLVAEDFYSLTLSEKDREIIDYIISTMATHNIVELAFNKRSMEKKGKKIEHVHPLRFMGFVLSTPQLKEDLRIIKKSSFKWDAVIDGFSRRMREELEHHNVYPHLPAFAALVGSTPDFVKPFIDDGDFEGLIKALL